MSYILNDNILLGDFKFIKCFQLLQMARKLPAVAVSLNDYDFHNS